MTEHPPELKLKLEKEPLLSKGGRGLVPLILFSTIGLLTFVAYGFLQDEDLMNVGMKHLQYNRGGQLQETGVNTQISILTQQAAQPVYTDSDKVVSVTLWDYDKEDGDIVRVQTSRMALDVTIAKTPFTLEIPYAEGDKLNFIGVRDGGGGITASVQVMMKPLPLPPLAVGQTITLPIL